jgi:hypothetical protein
LGQLENKKEKILKGEQIKETFEEIEKKIKNLKIMRLLIKGKKAKENLDKKNQEKLIKEEDKAYLNMNENENNNEKLETGNIICLIYKIYLLILRKLYSIKNN